jgi:sensor histidine kinase YesM
MNWHEFVFSEKPKLRLSRHIAFWLVWWLYFFGSRYFLLQPNHQTRKTEFLAWDSVDLITSLLILFAQMLTCYVVIYFLLPRYLLKAKYLLFVTGSIFLGFVLVQLTHFIQTFVTPFLKSVLIDTPTATKQVALWSSISAGGINSIKIITVAVAIKLGKRWWFNQKEKERLEKEKIEAELQLLKAQIHPDFLFNMLSNIYSFALMTSPKAPEMLLKLSEILSYMLYECNDRTVLLEREIKMLKDYMSLEKMRYGNKLEMNMHVSGDPGVKRIAPLLLLRLIENSFKQCSSRMVEQAWINLEMIIENDSLTMKLMNGKPLELAALEDGEEDDLVQAKKRLQLLYPGRHDLKITEEPEIMMVILEVMLESPSFNFSLKNKEAVLQS